MSKIGLKYISPGELNFPAVNGGKWNLASNFRGDFRKILSESGIGLSDYDTVALYMKFVMSGMFLCAAKRRNSANKDSYETLWLFLPHGTVIKEAEFIASVSELVSMFEHPESFSSAEAFQDILSDRFKKEFEEVPFQNIEAQMNGSRIGYINYEDESELALILTSGYKSQYENFGLILLTDNPVPVEASLPRIYLPELMLHRQLRREAETVIEEATSEEKKASEEETSEETTASEELVTSEEPVISEEPELLKDNETHEEKSQEVEEEDKEKEPEKAPEKDISEEVDDEKTAKPSSFSMVSFWGGFITATIIFLLIYIVVQVYQSLN